MTPTVLIIGGGIGGLALAQGLSRAGIRTDVYERTHERTDWLQGYRIHINPAGARALHDCLPPPAWQTFLDTVSTGAGGFGFLTDRATEVLGLTEPEINDPSAPPTARHYAVSRIRLREILLTGAPGTATEPADTPARWRLHLGKTFTHYEETAERVTAFFADGTSATADFLIGADGAKSRVRAQLLPHAAGRVDTGVIAVAGKHPLPATGLPQILTDRANLVIPRGQGSLFTATWQPGTGEDADGHGAGVGEDIAGGRDGGYVLWGFADAAERFPVNVETLDGAALRAFVSRRLDGWAPAYRRLIEGSAAGTVNAIRVRSAIPVEPWPSGRVTLLGDAVHSMTPMAGVGANTALRDADLLRRTLIAIAAGEAVGFAGYEREMLRYGFAAVRLSLRNARQAATSTRLGRAAFRATLRLTGAVPPMRRAMARGLGGG